MGKERGEGEGGGINAQGQRKGSPFAIVYKFPHHNPMLAQIDASRQ